MKFTYFDEQLYSDSDRAGQLRMSTPHIILLRNVS